MKISASALSIVVLFSKFFDFKKVKLKVSDILSGNIRELLGGDRMVQRYNM